jgi:hypothetical protein
MIVYLLLAFTFLFSGCSLFFIWRALSQGRGAYQLSAGITMAVFVYLYGAWIFLSYYAKYVFVILVIAVFIFSVYKRSKATTHLRRTFLFSMVAFFCTALSVLYFTGTAVFPYGRVDIAMPFKEGRYFVLQGGRGLPPNMMHASNRGAFAYAMDIVKLNSFGNRAKHIFSTALTDYEIYGDTIYSPCEGKLIHAINENPDNVPPNAIRGKFNTNGVVIATDKFYVCMVHMKFHTVFVKEGEWVKKGQPLGCVGNSGKSIEPHLHIQAHANTGKNKPWYQEPPLEIAFNGYTYRLFEVITVEDRIKN